MADSAIQHEAVAEAANGSDGSLDIERLTDFNVEIAVVKAAHSRLMDGYETALRLSSWAGNKGEASQTEEWGWVVRRLAGTHVRRVLADLMSVYLQLAQSRNTDDPEREWLDTTAASCEKTAATLPRMGLGGVLALLPVATTAAGAISNLPTDVFVIIAFLVPAATLGAYGVVRDAYRFKRRAFLHRARALDYEDSEEESAATDHNVYRDEDQLYQALGRRKRKERQVDLVVQGLLIFVTLESLLAVGHLVENIPGWAYLVAAGILALVAILWSAFYRPLDRRWT